MTVYNPSILAGPAIDPAANPGIFGPGLFGTGVFPQNITVSVSSLQLQAIGTTPPVLIPAPGVGFAVVILGGSVAYKFGTLVYAATSTPSIVVGYSGQSLNSGNAVAIAGSASAIATPISIALNGTAVSSIANKAIVLKEASGLNLASGPILTTTFNAGGTGYAAADAGTIAGGTGGTYAVDTAPGGVVATYHITAAGSGYPVGNAVATTHTSGSGNDGFKINITAITPGDGIINVTLSYMTIPV